MKEREVINNLLARIILHKKLCLVGALSLLGGSATTLCIPWVIRDFLLGASNEEFFEDIGELSSFLIGLFALQMCFFFLRHYSFSLIGYRVSFSLRKDLVEAILKKEMGFFKESPLGDLLNRESSDTQALQRAVGINLSVAFRYSLQVLGGLFMMFSLSRELTAILLICLPVVSALGITLSKTLSRASRSLQDSLGDATSILEEAISNMRSVILYGAREYEKTCHAEKIMEADSLAIKRTITASIFTSTMVFFTNTLLVILLWRGSVLIENASIGVADLLAFSLYGAIVAISLGFLANVADEISHAIGAAKRVFELMKTRVDPLPQKTLQAKSKDPATLEFKDVCFTYPGQRNPAISNVSFTCKQGQIIALVGESGAGKSTIFSLIPRFIKPTNGEISYKGIPIEDFCIESLHEEIAMVHQEPEIFSGSIEDNIRYGSFTAGKKEVQNAAKSASASEFISNMPQTWSSFVGRKGTKLSVGQKQRLAIARALLRSPKILLLDEATSALDSKNAHKLGEVISNISQDRITILISHRLNTIQKADEILLLGKGEIRERGTHSELLKMQGLYAKMVEKQKFE